MKLRLIDAFPTKERAMRLANDLRRQGVQFVRIRRFVQGRLKWGVLVGGKGSRAY